MKPQLLRKVLFGLVGFWVVASLVLAILTLTGVIARAHFEWLFVCGFVVFALLAGLMSRILTELKNPNQQK